MKTDMKTDRELLELAANAVGKKIDVESFGEYQEAHRGFVVADRDHWNPLINDGDALRLAVKLIIEYVCFDDMEQVNAGVRARPESWNCMTPYNGDKHAAVRRAITRAAAEIQLEKVRS